MKADAAGLFGRIKDNPIMMSLIAILVLSVVVMGYIAFVLFQDSQRDQRYLQLVGELRASSFQLTSLSRDATAGDEESFKSLEDVVNRMDITWKQLQASDKQTRIMMTDELSTYNAVWNDAKNNASVITENKETILFLHNVAETLNQAIPQLQNEHNVIVEVLLDNRAPADQVAVAQMQSWRAERIGRNVDKMLRGGADADRAADQFNLDASLFGKVLSGMESGDVAMDISRITDTDAQESLEEVGVLFGFVSGQVRDIFEASPALFQARQAANGILDESGALLAALSALSDQIAQLPAERKN